MHPGCKNFQKKWYGTAVKISLPDYEHVPHRKWCTFTAVYLLICVLIWSRVSVFALAICPCRFCTKKGKPFWHCLQQEYCKFTLKLSKTSYQYYWQQDYPPCVNCCALLKLLPQCMWNAQDFFKFARSFHSNWCFKYFNWWMDWHFQYFCKVAFLGHNLFTSQITDVTIVTVT